MSTPVDQKYQISKYIKKRYKGNSINNFPLNLAQTIQCPIDPTPSSSIPTNRKPSISELSIQTKNIEKE